MSISAAPAEMASRASRTLSAVASVPAGNATTAIGLTPQPSSRRAQSATLPDLTQTVANPYRRASSQSLTRSSWVAPGFSSV